MSRLRVIENAEDVPPPVTAGEVLQLVSDLIAEHLPAIPFDDPDRGRLVTLRLAVPPSRRGGS
jgi:hypothetical protein